MRPSSPKTNDAISRYGPTARYAYALADTVPARAIASAKNTRTMAKLKKVRAADAGLSTLEPVNEEHVLPGKVPVTTSWQHRCREHWYSPERIHPVVDTPIT